MFKKIAEYLKGVREEMTKVSWPTRDELKDSTLIVILLSLVLAIFIFGVDLGISNVIKIVL